MTKAYEVNFDGIVGPTHNYAGLSLGNLASMQNKKNVSSPREACLQGLTKMKALADLGLHQAVLPPQPRPDVGALRALGFTGAQDIAIIEKVGKIAPHLLAACYSASNMWTANSATVSPSADSSDGRLHITPANLISQYHRSLEAEMTTQALRRIFADEDRFAVHDPLPSCLHFSDEGAANHGRLTPEHGAPGFEIFVYGRRAFDPSAPAPRRFPARQTQEASESLIRLHQLKPNRTFLIQQNPEVIDAGVFHNDVISVANHRTLFYHEDAFLDPKPLLQAIDDFFSGDRWSPLMVPRTEVSVVDAVSSYLFNSQLLNLPDGRQMLLAPLECRESEAVWRYLQKIVDDPKSPIDVVETFDLRQSMRNGGGPACLRLRVVMTEMEIRALRGAVLLTPELHMQLVTWAQKRFRDRLSEADLLDPLLLRESYAALDELTQILQLGSLYPFQKI